MREKVSLVKKNFAHIRDTIKSFGILLIVMFLFITSIKISREVLSIFIGANNASHALGTNIGVFSVSFFLYYFIKKTIKIEDIFRIDIKSIKNLSIIVTGVSLILIFSFIFSLLFPETEGNIVRRMLLNSEGIEKYLLISSAVIVAPIAEEFLFRGIIQNWFKNNYKENYDLDNSATLSIIATSVLFAFVHVGSISSGAEEFISFMIPAFFISIVLGYSYEKTKSLTTPIIIHSINNFIAVIITFYSF